MAPLEQVMGIEPTFSAWKADVLAIVRHLQMGEVKELNLPSSSAKATTPDIAALVVNPNHIFPYMVKSCS